MNFLNIKSFHETKYFNWDANIKLHKCRKPGDHIDLFKKKVNPFVAPTEPFVDPSEPFVDHYEYSRGRETMPVTVRNSLNETRPPDTPVATSSSPWKYIGLTLILSAVAGGILIRNKF